MAPLRGVPALTGFAAAPMLPLPASADKPAVALASLWRTSPVVFSVVRRAG